MALPATDKLEKKLFALHQDSHFSVIGQKFPALFRLPPASASTKNCIQD
jgi:hypothetical protein